MRLPAILGLALLAACGAAAGDGPAPSVPPPRADHPLRELPPQRLGSGQCGLFLWARTPRPMLVLMGLDNPALARVSLGGEVVDVPRASFDGESVYGHYAVETFASDRLRLNVVVDFDEREGLLGGALVPSGTIEIVDAAGQTVVVPVGGMVACQG